MPRTQARCRRGSAAATARSCYPPPTSRSRRTRARTTGRWRGASRRSPAAALVAATGTRLGSKGKMMWEREYVEYAASVKGGMLTESEATQRGREFLADEAVVEDRKGPRGLLRWYVFKGDYGSSYTDLQRQDTAEARSAPRRRPTEEDIEGFQRAVLGASQTPYGASNTTAAPLTSGSTLAWHSHSVWEAACVCKLAGTIYNIRVWVPVGTRRVK